MGIFKIVSIQGKQVIILYISTFIGTLIGILSSVINTRSLDVSSYGDVRYVQNIIIFISSLLLVGYFQSGSRLLAISKSEQNSRAIRGIMIIILGIIILILMFSMILSYFIHIEFLSKSVAPLFLIAVPVCGNVLMLNYINTTAQGDNHIGRIAMARLIPTSIYVVAAYFIYSRFGATSSRMILLQSGIYSIVLLIIILTTKPSFKFIKSSFRRISTENKQYGIQLYYGSLAMVAMSYLSGITLGIYNTNNSEVGFYTLALTIASPLALLPSIIGTAYFKKFADQNKIDKKVMRNSMIITFVSCVLFIIIIKQVVMILYPESYSVVSTYAMFLAVGLSIHGFGDMINRFLGSHGQGKQIRNSSFFCGAILIVGSTGLVYFWGITGAIVTKILSSVTYSAFILYYYFKFVKFSSRTSHLV